MTNFQNQMYHSKNKDLPITLTLKWKLCGPEQLAKISHKRLPGVVIMDRKSVDFSKGDHMYAVKCYNVCLAVNPTYSISLYPAPGTWPTLYHSLEWRIHTHLGEPDHLEMQCICFSGEGITNLQTNLVVRFAV